MGELLPNPTYVRFDLVVGYDLGILPRDIVDVLEIRID